MVTFVQCCKSYVLLEMHVNLYKYQKAVLKKNQMFVM